MLEQKQKNEQNADGNSVSQPIAKPFVVGSQNTVEKEASLKKFRGFDNLRFESFDNCKTMNVIKSISCATEE